MKTIIIIIHRKELNLHINNRVKHLRMSNNKLHSKKYKNKFKIMIKKYRKLLLSSNNKLVKIKAMNFNKLHQVYTIF
jgi:hypothetical protein